MDPNYEAQRESAEKGKAAKDTKKDTAITTGMWFKSAAMH